VRVQGVTLLRDHGVLGRTELHGFVAGDELHPARDHLDRGLARVLVFLEVLALGQRDHGLLQRVLAAAVEVVGGTPAGRLARLGEHVLGNGGQRVFFHGPSLQSGSSPVTGTTCPSSREVTS